MSSRTNADMKDVAKVLLRAGPYYVMSRKRAPGERKDGRLEHLGGHVEPGESPLAAAIREAREEEATGRLAALLERDRPAPREVAVGRDAERHHLFEVALPEAEARDLRAAETESYGLELVPAAELDSDEGLRALRERLTPKTLAIYRALGRPV